MTKIKEVKVTATSVELITILGRIINERMQMPVVGLGWTIQFDAESTAQNEALYLMSGSCMTNDPDWLCILMNRLSITVRCERSWSSALLMWDLQIWVKHSSGFIDRYRYACNRDLTHCGRIFDTNYDPNDQMAETPPTKLALQAFIEKKRSATDESCRR